MPTLRRCHEFGQAVGRALRAFPRPGRAVVVGSGGLSHSPPSVSPFDPTVLAETRAYVIGGRGEAAAFNAATSFFFVSTICCKISGMDIVWIS